MTTDADAPAEIGALVMLRGTIDGDGHEPVLAWSTLKSSEGSPRTRVRQKPFRLRLSDGRGIDVASLDSPSVTTLLPAQEVSGRWDEICEHELVGLHGSGSEPGPHVVLEASGCIVHAGERVAIVGRVTATGPASDRSGYREASEIVIQSITPLVVVADPGAETLARKRLASLRPKPPRPRAPAFAPPNYVAHLGYVLVAAVSVAIAVAFVRAGVSRTVLCALALSLLATAFVARPAARATPLFRTPRNESSSDLLGLSYFVGGASVAGALVAFLVASDRHPSYLAVAIVGLVAPGIASLAALAWYLRVRRAQFRIIASILGAQSAEPRAGRRWRAFRGVVDVADSVSTPSRRDAALVRREEGDGTKTPNKTFTLVDGERRVEVQPSGATWASSVLEGDRGDKGLDDAVPVFIVPDGAQLIAASWAKEDADSLQSGGPESLVLFATEGDEDVVQSLRRTRRGHIGTALALVVAPLAYAACAWLIVADVSVPFLHPEYDNRYRATHSFPDTFVDACSLPNARVGLLASRDDDTFILSLSDFMYDGSPFFETRLYGTPTAQLVVSTNGWLSVLPQRSSGLSGRIPDPSTPNGVMAPFWIDLITRDIGICYGMEGTTPRRTLRVQWTNVGTYRGPRDSAHLTFQVAIHEAAPGRDNVIDFLYATMDGAPRDATSGIEDANGNDGYPRQFVLGHSNVRFSPR